MKAQIFHESNPHPEPFFISKGVKFAFLGTEICKGGAIHTIKNTENGTIKDVPHSILENIVEFKFKTK